MDSSTGVGKRARCVRWGAMFALLALNALGLRADEQPAWLISGFGTLGMARTTTRDVEFVRDLSQPRGIDNRWSGLIDSVLGAQFNWRLLPELEAVVQASSRYRYDRNFKPDVSWAYLKYDPSPNLSVRAGRLGTEFFMQADSRWVGYSFLSVRPVGDYFWYLPFYSIHGGDLALTVPIAESVLRAKAFYGHAEGRIPLSDQQWLIADSPMEGAYLEWQYGAWSIRGSYAKIHFANDLPLRPLLPSITPAQQAYLSTRGSRTDYFALGAIYDRGPWQAQLMLNHVNQGSRALENSAGGYALLGYRYASVTPYGGYSWVRSRRAPASGDPLIDYVISDSHTQQNTRFLGVRWDAMPKLAVKVQWDGIRGDASSLFPYRMDDRARWDGRMDVFSLTMDFLF